MRTKIIVTTGPACRDKAVLKDMILSGVRIFRLNFSHGNASDFVDLVRTLRELEKECHRTLTLFQDLSGPKIRIGELTAKTLEVRKGDILWLGLPSETGSKEPFMPFDQAEILEDLKVGDKVSLSDGALTLDVASRASAKLVSLEARNSGVVTSKKGITFPGKVSPISAVTEKDIEDIHGGVELGVDAMALSYVQGPEDIAKAKDILKKIGVWVPIIAKLERQSAVERLDEILALADGIMVARGDLGLECPLPQLPSLQKRIIRACNRASKPVIVATQMLLSMVKNPSPTRAETTDVANAILDGADCIMLSEETAVGNYPVETVRYMLDIAANAEEFFFEQFHPPLVPANADDPARALAYSACLLAEKCHAQGLVAHTKSGGSALLLSSCRPRQRVYALSPEPKVLSYLNFSWGVRPCQVLEDHHDHLERAETFVRGSNDFFEGQEVIITAGQPKPGQKQTPTNVVKIYTK